jgi:hypothetical protein
MNDKRSVGEQILRVVLITLLGVFVFAGLVLGACFMIFS